MRKHSWKHWPLYLTYRGDTWKRLLSSWSQLKIFHPRPLSLSKTKIYDNYYVLQAEVVSIKVSFHRANQPPTCRRCIPCHRCWPTEVHRPAAEQAWWMGAWDRDCHPGPQVRSFPSMYVTLSYPTQRESLSSQWLAKTMGQGSQCPLPWEMYKMRALGLLSPALGPRIEDGQNLKKGNWRGERCRLKEEVTFLSPAGLWGKERELTKWSPAGQAGLSGQVWLCAGVLRGFGSRDECMSVPCSLYRTSALLFTCLLTAQI